MPTYDYACPQCGDFDALRSLALRNEPCACPACAAPSPRVFVSAPRLACLSSDTRLAMATNERARHEPGSSKAMEGGYSRLSHPAGCGCCASASGTAGTSGKRSATQRAANGSKMFPSKRPWMISH